MATGGLYGNSGEGALIAQPGAETPGLYGKSPNGSAVATPGAESAGLYGSATTFGGSYFEWFVFQVATTAPTTPTGGSMTHPSSGMVRRLMTGEIRLTGTWAWCRKPGTRS